MSTAANAKPNGDHIVNIGPSSSEVVAEKQHQRLSTTKRPNKFISLEEADKEAEKPTHNNNDSAILDGSQENISRFQKIKPFLYRVLLLVVVGGILAIPIILGYQNEMVSNAHIGGVYVRWFFVWVEVFWCSIWISSIIVKYILPHVVRTLIGIFSKKAKKYHYVVKELDVPLTLLGWTFASFISFTPIMHGHEAVPYSVEWRTPVHQVLAGFLVTAGIYLGKSILIQIVYIRYRQAQLADKVTRNKEAIELLTKLYAESRRKYPDESDARFIADDRILAEAITFAVLDLGFDNHEDQARFAEASARVIWALEHKKTHCPSLARRIWGAFIKEGSFRLLPEDLEASKFDSDLIAKAFTILDQDVNGDITLKEMIDDIMEIARERKDLYSGWSDSQDIVASFSILCNVVVAALSILIFLAFLTSIKNTFGYAATVLASLGFAFNGTITELFAAIIFIFVKHPFDVGDCIEMDKEEYVVEHISLLYTQVRHNTTNKYAHFPNSVLNSKMVENLSRSKAMYEVFKISVSYDTTVEQIELLKAELRRFIEHNSREFHTREEDLIVNMSGFALDKLEIKIQVGYKGNYADGKRGRRKGMILRELLALTRSIPLYGPGGGGAALGSGDNPSFGVTVTPDDAKARVEAFNKNKESLRFRKSD
ncbi:hypothetical protein H072_679 [Dactylellina haptotyla CBS 200.50]|uniref:EF-hand domain-containing protein n=1 Tax=Dactylellina haptotyla (strain CBS 200.50) TaxID=1284197 RepID=S8CC42_DACHA|nr:hypothetical protein H072_679 [Dactylellina haptotyla CBS 200.50]